MMKRRDFIKNALLMSGTLLPVLSCHSGPGVTENKNQIKIVLIGVDGANWPTLDPLMEKGVLPFWKKLKEESAWANLKTFKPTKSSVIWTSIATGKKMEKHGILDFAFLDKNNIKVPFSNSERREPTIWQILSDYGKKSIVINWFASHPPDEINGILISDHFRRVVARPPEKINDYIESVKPSIYFHKLLTHIQRDYNEVLRETGLPDYPELYTQLHPGKNFRQAPILKTYHSMAVQDFFVTNISKELYRTKDFDLFATYIRMPDLVQHFSARMFDDRYKEELVTQLKNKTLTKDKHEEVILKIANIIEPAYKFAEGLLEALITYKKYEDAYFIIASDHGFALYSGGYNHYGLPDEYEAPAGILMIKGPGVRTGFLPSASVFDIAPSILNIFDLPVGKNMDGKVLNKALKLNRRMKYKIYKLDKIKKQRSSKADEETMKELESLGYIQRN
ncbi:MAG: alkaline phosphatase family protein [Candidatus Aminicenantes bacterium]|nr:MAG: alkaline phosphatase family protein [Candidatus Aminicenantes bacterium]